MIEVWKECEGLVVDEKFYLQQYLGGHENSGVFLTELADREPRKAAIKLILADPEDADSQLSRWQRAAKLSHPHLMRLFLMGHCHLRDLRLLYVVMEYADQDLSQVLLERPLTAEEARQMLEPAVDALAYVNAKGFVHGHLKPTNIMAVDDQLKVSSDGLLRLGESTRGPVKPGLYDPPEIVGAGISPAGDVWSLGMTIVEALTQHQYVFEYTEEPELVLPEILPAPFADIACHCLQTDPQCRWTVGDIAKRLQGVKPQRAFKRHYVLSAAVGLALVAVLAGLMLLSLSERHRASSTDSVQPGLERKPVTAERGQATQRGSDRQPASPDIESPGRLRSEAKAKAGSGPLVPQEIVRQVLPKVPEKARDTIQGKVRVRVRVRVDSSGSVAGTELDSPGPSRYFAELALNAAQRWRFAPAETGGRPGTSEWILRFEFSRTGAKVRYEQLVSSAAR